MKVLSQLTGDTKSQAAIIDVLQLDGKVSNLLMMVCLVLVFAGLLFYLFFRYANKDEKYKKTESIIILSVNLLGFILSTLLYGINLSNIKIFVVLLILSYGSVCDILHHEVNDSVSIMILITSLINNDIKSIPKGLIGFVITFVFLLIVSIVGGRKGKSIGGADIKIASSLSCSLGLIPGVFSLMLGTLISCFVMFFLIMFKKHEKGKPYALIPFINIGVVMVLLINY